MPVTIALRDARVTEVSQDRAKYELEVAVLLRDPFQESELYACQMCAIEEDLLTYQAICRHWSRAYKRLLFACDEVEGPFYFETKRFNRRDRVFSCSSLALVTYRQALRAWRSVAHKGVIDVIDANASMLGVTHSDSAAISL